MKIEAIAKQCKTIEIQQYFDGDDSEDFDAIMQGFLVKPNKGTLVSITRNFFDNALELFFNGFKRDHFFSYIAKNKEGKDERQYIIFKYFPKVLEHFKKDFEILENTYKREHNRADLTYEVILFGAKVKETFVLDSLTHGNLSIQNEKIPFINMLFEVVGKDELEKYLFMNFSTFKKEVLKIEKFQKDTQVWRWLDLLESKMKVPALMLEYVKELKDLLNHARVNDIELFKKIVALDQRKEKIDTTIGLVNLFGGLILLRTVTVLKNITLYGSCAEPMKYTMSDHFSGNSVNTIDEPEGTLHLKTFFPFISHDEYAEDKAAKMEAYIRYTNILFQELGIEEGEVSFTLINEYKKKVPNSDPFREIEICDALSNDSDVMAILSIPLRNFKSAMDWYFKHIFLRYWTRIVENQEFTYEVFLEWEKGNLKTKSGRPVLLTELLMLLHQWCFNDPTFCHTAISGIRVHRFSPTTVSTVNKLAVAIGEPKEGASFACSWKILNRVFPLNSYLDKLKEAADLKKDYVGSMNEFCKSLNLSDLLPSNIIKEKKIETSLTFMNDSESLMLELIAELKEKLGKEFHRNSVPQLKGSILEIVCKHVISD